MIESTRTSGREADLQPPHNQGVADRAGKLEGIAMLKLADTNTVEVEGNPEQARRGPVSLGDRTGNSAAVSGEGDRRTRSLRLSRAMWPNVEPN